ncbi:pyrroloquinoline quinone-dependent dehydrogenase [Cohnella terricola]|uniref:PQQ-binding-like beta-propeller repeat protein n=1 Tax=Cohnella terricola TaxID=1289167 RepID=A0A559JKH2_9BACL|nr:PQQ-binding-like beta-propeller repeat protein [Cohnella terricola]TVY00378.1 PQQ-binding-like beta-propeller repeat protein [Cohnella terricola]
MKKSLTVVGAVLAASMALTACSSNNNNSQSSPSASASSSPSASPSASQTAATYENFPHVHYDLGATRHVPFTEITKDNVNDLGVVWTLDFKSLDPSIPNGNQNFSMVIDGIAYLTTSKNHVFAVNALTGEPIWHWAPDEALYENTKNMYIVANRGVAVAEGKVYMLLLDNRLVAIDQKTGETVKIVNISDAVEGVTVENGYYETVAPVYFNGNIYVGSSGGDNGVRGFVMAYKASDLTAAWDSPFWVVPPKGQDWLKNAKWNGGGAVWNPMSFDEETGLMYFGTGNPAPDLYGVDRPGANPYTDSIVALDSATGKLVWVQQQVSHDLWDYDSAATPMLITAKINGAERKVVVHGSKSGEWWAYDYKTGEIIYDAVQFAKIIDHPEPTEEGVLIYPGIYGGQNYAPETYDPESNYVLIPGIEMPSLVKSAPDGAEEVSEFGTTIGEVPPDIIPYGTVTAIDMNTGKVAYQYDTDQEMRGGFTSTASGIAFYGELNGKFRALDIKSGKIIWEFQIDGNTIMSAPSIFTVDGKQYILLTSGGTKPKAFVFALGGDKTQGAATESTEKGAHG